MGTEAARPITPTARPALPDTRRATPVKWFAAAGALACAMQVYLFTRWILSGPRRTEAGPDEIPEFMRIAVVGVQILSPILLLVCLYFAVFRPWRRDGRLGLTGIVCLALPTAWWQDIAFNYFNPSVTVNAHFINFGSWYSFIPGWSSPNGERLIEPILFTGPVFVWALLPYGLALAWLMRRAKRRWPGIGMVGLLAIGIGTAAIYDILLEVPMHYLGIFNYVGTIPSLTINAGHYYQYPLYEAPLFGMQFAAIGALLYFRNDRGETVAERGVERVNATAKRKSGLRFLAVAGYINLTWVTYNILMALTTLMPGFTWAEDGMKDRSYLRNELCGPGTTVACPSADLPIPREGGIHVSPEGKLIVPKDAKLPTSQPTEP